MAAAACCMCNAAQARKAKMMLHHAGGPIKVPAIYSHDNKSLPGAIMPQAEPRHTPEIGISTARWGLRS